MTVMLGDLRRVKRGGNNCGPVACGAVVSFGYDRSSNLSGLV